MAYRFVTFAEGGNADYTVNGTDFKYLDLSQEEAETIMTEARGYEVLKSVIERYSHDEYGDYESLVESISYNLSDMRSISEKIWDKHQGSGDIIVVDERFFGVVFFTGLVDPEGKSELGFVPLEHKDSREGLTVYTSVSFAIMRREDLDVATGGRVAEGEYNGRVSTSWNTTYSLRRVR